MDIVKFKVGETIFREGDESDYAYRIVAGQCEVSITTKGLMRREDTNVLATVGAGEIIGEMGAIDGGARSATIIATRPTEAERYTPDEIIDVLENNPDQAMAYVRTLIKRLRNRNLATSVVAASARD